MQRTTPRFDPDTLGDEDRARQDCRVVLTIVLCVALGSGLMVLRPWMTPALRDDIAGSPVQSATGRITHIRYTKQDSDITPSPYFVNVLEIDGRTFNVRNIGIQQELRKGQRVRVSYVTGKSGQWYLRAIQPE